MSTAAALVPKKVKAPGSLASYVVLRRRVRETLLWGRQKIEEARVRTYWETGWWIKKHILLNQFRADYGRRVLLRLSRDEDISESVLHRCLLFSEKFPDIFPKPILARGPKSFGDPRQISRKSLAGRLVWSHFRTLLPLEDDKLRLQLAQEAARKGWSVPQLETQIKSSIAGEKSGTKSSRTAQDSPPKDARLKPKKGEVFTYRILKDGGVLALDQGFAKYWNLSEGEAKQFSEGDIVRRPPGGKMEKLKNGSRALLYTYEAEVVRIVDADTIWMKIYLEGRGGPPWVKEKLRLRDLDAPELKTPEGRAAKKFVEETAAGKQILITTTKPDKWDRYLTDVFLTSSHGETLYLNNLLIEKGHARLKTDWSLNDWEG